MLKTYLKKIIIFHAFFFISPTSFANTPADSTTPGQFPPAVKSNLPFEIESGKVTPSATDTTATLQNFNTSTQCPKNYIPYISLDIAQLTQQPNQVITNVAACVWGIFNGSAYSAPGGYQVLYYAVTKNAGTMTAQICANSKTLYASSSSGGFDSGSSKHFAYSNSCGGSTYVNIGTTDANGNQYTGQIISNVTSINNMGVNEIIWHLICYPPNTNPSINVNIGTAGDYYTFPNCGTGSSFTTP